MKFNELFVRAFQLAQFLLPSLISTKKNNGLVEIEASNDNTVLTSFPRNNQENSLENID